MTLEEAKESLRAVLGEIGPVTLEEKETHFTLWVEEPRPTKNKAWWEISLQQLLALSGRFGTQDITVTYCGGYGSYFWLGIRKEYTK